MNTTAINGFDIDKFNQYELPVGKKESTCPLCSSERSPKNQKSKCASLDWNTGIGTCHHCNQTFQLHTFKKKKGREYSKPKANDGKLDPRIIEWFSTVRGISESTLRQAKVTTSPGWIEFNFYAYGELVK